MDKLTIRKIFQDRRSKLSADEIITKSQLITNNFIKNLLPKIPNFTNKKLAFYIAVNNEVDGKFLINYCSKIGNIISLPISSLSSKQLVFKEYKIGDELEKNILYSKLHEPKADNKNIEPDILFIPLLAFDRNCHRVGMGGGFYDFTINNLRSHQRNTIFIGLAYDSQLCEQIPVHQMDQSLDFIVSESFIFSHRQQTHNSA